MVLNTLDMGIQSLTDKRITACLLLIILEFFFDGKFFFFVLMIDSLHKQMNRDTSYKCDVMVHYVCVRCAMCDEKGHISSFRNILISMSKLTFFFHFFEWNLL